MRTPDKLVSRYSALAAGLILVLGLGILAGPSKSATAPSATPQAAVLGSLLHVAHALPAAAQDAGQATPSPASTAPATAAPKPVVLPDGDGKPIATEYCQMCHRLTNLTKAHKSLDDWKDTVQTMIDRGATIPDDKVDTLVQYLAKNFGPQDAAPAANSPAAAPAAPAANSPAGTPPAAAPDAAAAPSAPASSSASAAPVVLPDGDGKEIATENCQACHKLTNLTKAHKSLDDWKDTVQLMIDRGANVPPDKVDTLVQYLAKNFGPAPASATPPAAPAQQ